MRQAVILVALLLVAFAAYMAAPRPQAAAADDNSVKQFVLEDAKNDYPTAVVEALSAENAAGKWQIDVKIAVDAHSKCPKLYRRYYSYPPIYFREEVINDRCQASGSIIYPEEAILASTQNAAVRSLPESATATARAYSEQELGQLRDCAACGRLEEFAKTLPLEKLWIVQWQDVEAQAFVAVDADGKVVASG